ncbi:MAG: AAA family ATPase [Deltaproteobacteria bacterium]|nr:AAA family ATPase [Deltaproteobacteria bacterium]
MEHAQQILFGPFRLDPSTERLWRGEQEVALRAKPWAVLRYLAEHPRRVVTKEELLKTVWAGTYVTKTVLKVCVREIREALDEEVAAPRYIATVGHLGYQFLGDGRAEATDTEAPAARIAARRIVGRTRESTQLQRWLTHAGGGARCLGFVTGEAGIGKTVLVDLFLDRVRATGQVRLGRGQCVEQYGEGEAYLPVLEAFTQLGRAPGGQQVLDVLSHYAPTWLVQMPALVSEADLEVLQRKVQGVTRARMLREIAEALEALTAERPLVLVFEDLHWSDSSTLELLAYLARRREPARLLVIGTYRPTEVIVSSHPLKGITQELQAHEQCEELRLELLTEGDVADYVVGQFALGPQGQRQSPAAAIPFQQLAQVIHRRTDGNALFMVNLVEHLVRQGVVVEEEGHWRVKGNVADLAGDVPENLRQLIERQIERLSAEEQRVLEVASVAGAEFAVAAVAAGSKREAEAVEEVCEKLAWQGHFLQERGLEEWPDGTVSGRYQFCHALYHTIFYERVAEARRVRLHRQIGERKEQAYGKRAGEIAAELALHFEWGRQYPQAVQYHQRAAERATWRSAHQEAIGHLNKGLALLETLPETPERAQHELTLLVTLGISLRATLGWAAPEVERVYMRARTLCQQVGQSPQLFALQMGLCTFFMARAEYQTARELTERLLTLAPQVQNPDYLLIAHVLMGLTLYRLGEFALAREHFEQDRTLSQAEERALTGPIGPEVYCRSCAAWNLWILGHPDQALQSSHDALRLAEKLAHPFTLARALSDAAAFHLLRKEGDTAQAYVEQYLALSTAHSFALDLAIGTSQRGEAVVRQGQGEEGIALLREGLIALQATGVEAERSYRLAVLAANT